MDSIMTILLTIIIFVGIVTMIYVIYYNNLQAYKIKINEAESIIDEYLRRKYDTLDMLIDIITDETDATDKAFNEFKNLKNINISSFDFERRLAEINALIDKIKLDYDELDKNEGFTNYYDDLYRINEKLEATKSFYNKYTSLLNKTIKKFPSNIIAFIHHIKVQAFFDGKDMFDDDIKDFKL